MERNSDIFQNTFQSLNLSIFRTITSNLVCRQIAVIVVGQRRERHAVNQLTLNVSRVKVTQVSRGKK